MTWLAAAGPIAVLVTLLGWAWRALRRRTFGGLLANFCRRMARLRAVRRLRTRHPRLWAFLSRRVTPAGVFGLHLTIGLGVSVLALGAFIRIADDVLERDDLARVDGIVAGIVASHLTPTEVRACLIASAIVTYGMLAFLLLLRARDRGWGDVT